MLIKLYLSINVVYRFFFRSFDVFVFKYNIFPFLADWNIKGSISKLFALFGWRFFSFLFFFSCYICVLWPNNDENSIHFQQINIDWKEKLQSREKSIPQKTQIVSKLNEIECSIHTEIDLKRRENLWTYYVPILH